MIKRKFSLLLLLLLLFSIQSAQYSNLYVDLPGYNNPSVLTGDKLRPDMLITLQNKCIYILELTIGYTAKNHQPVAMLL